MSKKIIFRAVGQVAAKYGDKWARIAGDKAVARLSKLMQDRGYSDRSYDLNSLTEELKEKYRQGKFSKEEWAEIKSRLKQAWEERRKK